MSKLKIEEYKTIHTGNSGYYCRISVAKDEDAHDSGEVTILAEACASSKEKALRQARLEAHDTLKAWALEIEKYYAEAIQ